MTSSPAFAPPAAATSFTVRRTALSAHRAPLRTKAAPARRGPRMADDKPFFSNPFAPKKTQESQPGSAFTEPQPGDPGYKPPPVPAKSEPSAAAPAATGDAPAAQKLPVVSGSGPAAAVKRGLDLLKEDLFKSAPESVGVGRQDRDVTMKPVAGEPGFKPQSYQTVKVSQLGISPFVDDANAVGKVGGIEAVKKAAIDVTKGKSAKEIKKAILKIDSGQEKDTVIDIPDYLKPLPEDTPRKGMTWKNYAGR